MERDLIDHLIAFNVDDFFHVLARVLSTAFFVIVVPFVKVLEEDGLEQNNDTDEGLFGRHWYTCSI